MTISVALCTYNGAPYLEEQLASIATQTRQPDEVVVCDDCSHDDTVAIIRAFAAGAPFPVRLYRNDINLGFTRNFDQAIGYCAGDLIALADQDDVWHATKLALIEARLSESPQIGMVFSDAEVVGSELQPLGYGLWESVGFTAADQRRFREGRGFDVLLKNNVVTGATLAFRSRHKNLFLPISTQWVHDEWIALLISATAEVACIEQPLIKYRQHANQIGARKRTYLQRVLTATSESRDIFLSAMGRFEAVDVRLVESGIPLADRQAHLKLLGKIHHLQTRGGIPNRTWPKLALILRELRSGRYHQYSFGFRSAIADFLRSS